jgi:hypothetical protein
MLSCVDVHLLFSLLYLIAQCTIMDHLKLLAVKLTFLHIFFFWNTNFVEDLGLTFKLYVIRAICHFFCEPIVSFFTSFFLVTFNVMFSVQAICLRAVGDCFLKIQVE